mmetsp:Transcript_37882/g.61622  ORF Transcript_37882/g.61622 Transcript_37882/m.61622 type:complete len:260 (-) Transcript_37882:481-1260(-)
MRCSRIKERLYYDDPVQNQTAPSHILLSPDLLLKILIRLIILVTDHRLGLRTRLPLFRTVRFFFFLFGLFSSVFLAGRGTIIIVILLLIIFTLPFIVVSLVFLVTATVVIVGVGHAFLLQPFSGAGKHRLQDNGIFIDQRSFYVVRLSILTEKHDICLQIVQTTVSVISNSLLDFLEINRLGNDFIVLWQVFLRWQLEEGFTQNPVISVFVVEDHVQYFLHDGGQFAGVGGQLLHWGTPTLLLGLRLLLLLRLPLPRLL